LQNRETRLNTVFFCAFLLEYKKISKYFKNTLLFIWITFINVVSLYQQKKQFIFIFNSQQLFIIMKKANAQNIRACKALEVIADAANQLLHIDIAAEVAAQDEQLAANEAINENNGIDFVQVYIDGMPNKAASAGVMHTASGKYIQYFLRDDLAVNTAVKLNSSVFYLEETILDTCYQHENGVWEFWANPAFPDEKSLLMIYLSTQPIKARKKPRYPHESDYFDYANGGDGYTANEVLDF